MSVCNVAAGVVVSALCSVSPGSFDPHMLVLMAYALVVADCFPEEVFREIFNVDFLAKLDAHLESRCWRFSGHAITITSLFR